MHNKTHAVGLRQAALASAADAKRYNARENIKVKMQLGDGGRPT